MRLLTTATLTSVLALTSTACLNGGDPFMDDRGVGLTNEPSALGPIQAALRGNLNGSVGPAAGLRDEATEMSTYDDGYYVTVETVVEKPERAVMTLLSVSNVGDLFTVGNRGNWTLGGEAQDGTRVTMLGCVGDEVGVYNEYDKPADEIGLDIGEPASGADGEMDVTVDARWYDRDAQGNKLETYRDAVTAFTLVR